ncbi:MULTISPECIES: hypothetical protein [Burkholderia cepacia complex]|uniref:hypothetical protein n=1 Tax=Burkholderia cepacia complex TaxID=87882 RepID=UPI0015893763|nr:MULTISPECIES: hypothetical protein [Burkholderia cepacia complex]MBR8303688.1 hypothetical protein [Burkholderia dolosa]HDR9164874.1 hypothetical protein [Burkholderia vietnamiensis]
MNEDLQFIDAQILQAKARLCDFMIAREEEEKRLVSLTGAREILLATERRKTQAPEAAAQAAEGADRG